MLYKLTIFIAAIVLISGCGGEDSSGSATSNTKTIKESVTSSSYSFFDGFGLSNAYTFTSGCILNSFAGHDNITVYEDGTVETYNDYYDTSSSCNVDKVFNKINLIDGDINATYIDQSTFYDANTSIYYETRDLNVYDKMVLQKITNDAILSEGMRPTYSNIYVFRMFGAYIEKK